MEGSREVKLELLRGLSVLPVLNLDDLNKILLHDEVDGLVDKIKDKASKSRFLNGEDEKTLVEAFVKDGPYEFETLKDGSVVVKDGSNFAKTRQVVDVDSMDIEKLANVALVRLQEKYNQMARSETKMDEDIAKKFKDYISLADQYATIDRAQVESPVNQEEWIDSLNEKKFLLRSLAASKTTIYKDDLDAFMSNGIFEDYEKRIGKDSLVKSRIAVTRKKAGSNEVERFYAEHIGEDGNDGIFSMPFDVDSMDMDRLSFVSIAGLKNSFLLVDGKKTKEEQAQNISKMILVAEGFEKERRKDPNVSVLDIGEAVDRFINLSSGPSIISDIANYTGREGKSFGIGTLTYTQEK